MVFYFNNFTFVQDTLKRMRVVDDKIVYALNRTVPTESFSTKVDSNATCKDLFSQVGWEHSLFEFNYDVCKPQLKN